MERRNMDVQNVERGLVLATSGWDGTTVDCGFMGSFLVYQKKYGPTYKISSNFIYAKSVLRIKLFYKGVNNLVDNTA